MDYSTLKLVESNGSRMKIQLPYYPTFLAFREVPAIVGAVRKMKRRPDVILVNGHGVAHPRGCGLASHIGLMLGIPTIGVAKSRLFGVVRGQRLLDDSGRVIGLVVRKERGNSRRELFVSIGHKVSLRDAASVVLRCIRNSFPEPLRLAHEAASRMKRRMRA